MKCFHFVFQQSLYYSKVLFAFVIFTNVIQCPKIVYVAFFAF